MTPSCRISFTCDRKLLDIFPPGYFRFSKGAQPRVPVIGEHILIMEKGEFSIKKVVEFESIYPQNIVFVQGIPAIIVEKNYPPGLTFFIEHHCILYGSADPVTTWSNQSDISKSAWVALENKYLKKDS